MVKVETEAPAIGRKPSATATPSTLDKRASPRLYQIARHNLKSNSGVRGAVPAADAAAHPPGLEPVALRGVHLVEAASPPGEEAVQWRLLTSLPVEDADAAIEIMRHYLQLWRIEDFFRVLQSGCRVEHLAFRTADRLQRAIAINSVIAWRLMAMTRLGRQVPDCAAELLFTDSELSFLSDYAEDFRLPGLDRLGPAARLVAHLGLPGPQA